MMMHPAIGPSIALLNEVVPKTNKLDIISFGSFFCMLLEEWCLTHNEDAPKLALDLAYMVDAVNKSEGKKFGFNFFIIMNNGEIRKDLDKQPKAIGRTEEEALQCLKNSLQYKLELREKDLEEAKRKVKSISQEIDMLNNVLKTK